MRAIQALPPAALFERSLSRKPHTGPESPKPHLSRHPSGGRESFIGKCLAPSWRLRMAIENGRWP